jgi:hypothetical protein
MVLCAKSDDKMAPDAPPSSFPGVSDDGGACGSRNEIEIWRD